MGGGIDPRIALGVQVPQIEGPMDLQKGSLSVQQLINAVQLQKQQQASMQIAQQQQQIELQQQQQAQKDTQAFNKAYMDAGGDWDTTLKNATAGGVSGTFLTQKQMAHADLISKMASTEEAQHKNELTKSDELAKQAYALKQIEDPADRETEYQTWRNGKISTGAYKSSDLPATVPNDKYLDSIIASNKTVQDMAEKAATLRKQNAELPGQQAEANVKRAASAAQMMAGVGNQIAWTARRNFVAKSDPEMAAQIPENYSPEAAEQVKQMGISPEKMFAGPPVEKLELASFMQNPPKGYKATPAEFMRYQKSIAPNITAVIAAGGGPSGPLGNANDQGTQSLIDLVGQNKAKISDVLTPRTPLAARKAFLANVVAQYPDFDTKNYDVEKGVEKAFTSGQYSQQLNSISRAREHMGTFLDLAKNINNTDVQVVNRIKNAWISQFGGSAPTNLGIAKQAFASEVGKSFAGANVALHDREELSNKISEASSWEQLRDAAATADSLLAGAQKALKKTYESGMQGKPNFGEDTGEKKATHRYNMATGKIEAIGANP